MNLELIPGDDQEEDIDQMISEAEISEDNQEMEGGSGRDEQSSQDDVRKRKHGRVRELLASLNRLSAALFATISVAERQITVLQDLHNVFLTNYRTKRKDFERGYPLRRSPFHRSVAPVPVLSENSEQIWPNTLDTVDEVVRERESFIRKVKGLVENMDIRRKIV